MGQYGSFSDKNQQVHACMCIHVLYMEFIVQGADVPCVRFFIILPIQ